MWQIQEIYDGDGYDSVRKSKSTDDTDRLSPKYRPVVVAGPSGVGKSTLITMLRERYPESFGFSVSHTTRLPRPGESGGVQYHFVSRDTFEELARDGAFVETAEFAGNCYGTSKRALNDVNESGRICLLDIDLQGVRQVKRAEGLDAGFVFLAPPSKAVLEARLRGRGDTSPAAIEKRLLTANIELEAAAEVGLFDFVVVNDDKQRAVLEFANAIKSFNPQFDYK
jgi:guanylate kinase